MGDASCARKVPILTLMENIAKNAIQELYALGVKKSHLDLDIGDQIKQVRTLLNVPILRFAWVEIKLSR
jgi:hypothetical protein